MRAEGDIQSIQAQLYLALDTCQLPDAMKSLKADKTRQVVGLAIELEDLGKGLLEWKRVEK